MLTRASSAITAAALAVAFWASAIHAQVDFSTAERYVQEFERDYRDLSKLDQTELTALVRAICDAEEEARRSVASSAGSRAKSKVNSEFNKLQREKDEALEALNDVLGDEAQKDRHSAAEKYIAQVNKHWESIDRMTRSVRGANHPVVKWMLETGKKVHLDYQKNKSNCTVWEFSLPSGRRVDCILASVKPCRVIELKPNNSRAVRNGLAQARDYADELNNSEAARQKLVGANSRFADCDKFVFEVQAYTLCPVIDENGEFKAVPEKWARKT